MLHKLLFSLPTRISDFDILSHLSFGIQSYFLSTFNKNVSLADLNEQIYQKFEMD